MENVPRKQNYFFRSVEIRLEHVQNFSTQRNQQNYQTIQRRQELGKAMTWARMNVSKTIVNWDFDEWKTFANEHKTEGTIWQLAAKFARIQDSEFYSFC